MGTNTARDPNMTSGAINAGKRALMSWGNSIATYGTIQGKIDMCST